MIDSVHPDLHRAKRKPHVAAGRVDRLPPYSLEAEQGVLGCILLDPKPTLCALFARWKNFGEFLYDARHQTIFAELALMFDENVEIDTITLQQRLRDKGMLEGIGGLAYLSSLQDAVPSAANLMYYAEIVWDKYLLRQMISSCNEAVDNAYEFEGDVREIIHATEQQLCELGQGITRRELSIKEATQACVKRIEELHAKTAPTGLLTGFVDFDRMTGGLHPGEIVVIAARPSIGKSSLAMNMAAHLALELGLPVGMFSLEMSTESLVMRLIASRARVSLGRINHGELTESDFRRLPSAISQIQSSRLHLDDTGGLTDTQVRAKARLWHSAYGIKALVVDYLQLMSHAGRRSENRQAEVSAVSGGLKALAKELQLPIIVLSQLNREVESKARKPRLSDLRESGAIEQDADLVGLLSRESTEDEDANSIPMILEIAKQRNGPTGDIHLTFIRDLTRFESAAKISDADVPTKAPYKDP